MPACSLVAALNSLQKPMMFTPCCPNAGPTGGAVLACPAGICSLICPTTFLAIKFFVCLAQRLRPIADRFGFYLFNGLRFFYLRVFQIHQGLAPKYNDVYSQLSALAQNLFNDSAEIHKRAALDSHAVAGIKFRFRVHLRRAAYAFSTCQYSNSTGVLRPKILTVTFNLPRSGSTSSITPLKFRNGPSLILTVSPVSKFTFGFSVSSDSEICVLMVAISSGLTGIGRSPPTMPIFPGVSWIKYQGRSKIRLFSSTSTISIYT